MEQALERRVHIIPATKKPTDPKSSHHGKQRVAAYCRVSTNNKEQINSYEAQKVYYTQKIEENPDWELAGILDVYKRQPGRHETDSGSVCFLKEPQWAPLLFEKFTSAVRITTRTGAQCPP